MHNFIDIKHLQTNIQHQFKHKTKILSVPHRKHITFLVTLMMEALRSSETSALTEATRRNITQYAIVHSHRRENLKSYIALTG
jgi:hypothetical protein